MEKKSKKIIIISVLVTLVLALVIISVLIFIVTRDTAFDISGSPATLTNTPDYGENYLNSIVFLCDSTLSGMANTATEQNNSNSRQVWTGKNGKLALDSKIDKATVIISDTGDELTITQALERQKPRYIVIALGFENGVPYCDKEAFCRYYEKIISVVSEASPDTKIMLQSILPVTSKFEFLNKEYSNEVIDICNTWICELSENHSMRFLNTAEALKNSSGKLNSDYANKDGSLNDAGYLKVFEYVRTHGYKDLSDGNSQ